LSIAEIEQDSRRKDIIKRYIAMAEAAFMNDIDCFQHVLFYLGYGRFVWKSLSEGRFVDTLDVEKTSVRVDTVKFWYTTMKTADFIQGTIGVGFRVKCFLVLNLVCQLVKNNTTRTITTHAFNRIFVITIDHAISAMSEFLSLCHVGQPLLLLWLLL
jgi:hypothetical protein